MNDYKKRISHLKNIDSKLADHILDEIIERYIVLHVSSNVCINYSVCKCCTCIYANSLFTVTFHLQLVELFDLNFWDTVQYGSEISFVC